LHPVKRMIRGIGDVKSSTYSQTLNGCDVFSCFGEEKTRMRAPSGPFLVSRTGAVG
jgi:hypothetical protein